MAAQLGLQCSPLPKIPNFSPAGQINTEKLLYLKTQIGFLYYLYIAVWMLNPCFYSPVESVIR